MTTVTLILGLLLSTLTPGETGSTEQIENSQTAESQEGCDFIIADTTDM